MLNFFRRLSVLRQNGPPRALPAPASPSKSLRHSLKKYVAESAIELAPEILPEFVTPTVSPTGAYLVEAVGKSFNQPALLAIAGIPSGADAVEWEGIAQLVAEPDNPFDPNTVRVVIQEMTVGHLPQDLARQLQETILNSEEPVTVRSKLTGGFRLGDGTRAQIDVLLDFDPDELATNPGWTNRM